MADPRAKAFLGIGWAFPAAADARGDIGVTAYEEDVRQAILIILGTARGERVMRPDFGAGLNRLVFEPLGATTSEMVRHEVEQALASWEPRIDHVKVEVTTEPPQGRLNIRIRYRIRSINTFYNLVYPFYLFEGKPA